MSKASSLMAVVALSALSGGSVLADGIFQNSYAQTASFDGSPGNLNDTSMNMTFDGNHYWSSSGGGPSGNRLAEWTGGGSYVASYQPNIDMRSVFTVGGTSSPVYCRGFASPTIMKQTSPGSFTSDVTLSGGTLDAQSQVEFNSDGTEFVAHINGNISRWNLSGAFVGNVSLSGYGSMFSEGNYPQYRAVVCAGGYYLTYSNGMLSAWDASGTRVGTTALTGAGTSFDSHFSLSWANGMIWVIDVANGIWRGYEIPELGGNSVYTCAVSGSCPGTVTVRWNNATPSHQQGIVFGNSLGNTTIPNGPCQGTTLGIQGSVRLVNTIGTGSGSGQINGQAGTAACHHYLQLVESGSCNTSTVGQIP